MNIESLGWSPSLHQQFEQLKSNGFVPARVAEEHRERYIVFGEFGERSAEITGKLRFSSNSRLDFPAVGDWVAVQTGANDSLAVIHSVMPRTTTFLRKVAGETTEPQLLATNIDTVFLVTDLGLDFNVRRLERYLVLTYESGATPVIVLNKADLCPDTSEKLAEIETVAVSVPCHCVSAVTGNGIDALLQYATPGKTVALLGSSGVGKSSIINCLIGEERLETKEIRESDGRGRHTTTARQMILLPSGGIVIDTPGMREIQLWGDETSLDLSFEDIQSVAQHCRFADCSHATEPGCAIKAALENGTISAERWESYLKLQRELRHLERKQNIRVRLDDKALWKQRHKVGQENMRRKYGSQG